MKQETPRSNRLHILLLGKRNSGKSSLINQLTQQQVSVVSSVPGTTTDTVYQSMEIPGLGPCVWMDTAGFDDEGTLGELRVGQTLRALDKADVALLLCTDMHVVQEQAWLQRLHAKKIPVVVLLSKVDTLLHPQFVLQELKKTLGLEVLPISTQQGTGMEQLRQSLIQVAAHHVQLPIVAHLVHPGDVVLLVMPQDEQAPKGRLILPQVQTLRELLDIGCVPVCCTPNQLEHTIHALVRPPQLIITDSQVFHLVYALKPADSLLTSFSVLFARQKGDIDYFTQSTLALEQLTPNSHILIAEACTHAPLNEDIGRVKLPRLLRKRVGETLQIDTVSGADFPTDLSPYQLVIHCGACMFNRKHVLSRVEQAKQQAVPMTNYGITLAWLNGILDKIIY